MLVESVKHCERCGFPDTRPGLIFRDGVCGACINFEKRKGIDWIKRKEMLQSIVTQYRGRTKYDCLIPVSGGKDSYFLVKTITDMGMNPLLVTVTDSFTHTKAGTHNLRNLIEKFNLNHWQYTISHDLFRRATRVSFEDTGEPLKFVEYAIYTIPVRLAQSMGIPLVVFGENSAYEYGSTEDDNYSANEQIQQMVGKIKDELPWWTRSGIISQEVESILPLWPLGRENPLVMFMSHFYPWSSVHNLDVAKSLGFRDLTGEWERKGVIEQFEQIDSVAYMAHLWMKYPKFGFQRTTDIATRRVREGLITLDQANDLISKNDHILDPIAKKDFCESMGYTEMEFDEIAQKHWRKEVH